MGLFEYDADDIVTALETWDPDPQPTESAYEDLLYRHLNAHKPFRKFVFHRQYRMAKTIADIYVDIEGGARVAIEVKAHLQSRAEFHRLMGQLYEYARIWKCEVVLVLCGDCDGSLLKLTEQFCEWLNEHVGPKIRFVEKQVQEVDADRE